MKDRVTDFGRRTVDNSTIPAKQLQALSTPQPQLSILSRRSNQRRGMVGDIEDILKRYPAQTLAAAAFFGFLLGRAFRRYD